MRLLALVAAISLIGACSALPTGFKDTVQFSVTGLPTGLAFAPDGRMFVLEKTGRIQIYKNGALLATPFATIQCESSMGRGLLGIAFDPSFATNHFVYLYYTAGANSFQPPATPKNRVVRVVADGDTMMAGSETVLLDYIASDSGSDNGGTIRFGLDGKLFISTGDGGQDITSSQNLESLAGKLLRINPDGTVPGDNPFVGQLPRRPEIWAYGFRNPFRFCIRPGTNVPFVGDVGEVTWEEIDVAVPGANYGWPNAEGAIGGLDYVDPIYTYNHFGSSMCVIGGIFAKSTRFPVSYANRYLFADYKLKQFYFADFNALNQIVTNGTWGESGNGPVDFAFGADGALYYPCILDKTIHKIAYKPSASAIAAPSTIDGGANGSGTVSLDVEAPSGRQSVSLTSSNPAILSVPSSIVFEGGTTVAPFAITTQPVTALTAVTVTASLGVSKSQVVNVVPNGVKALYLASGEMLSGASGNCTVALTTATAEAITVQISASGAIQTVPLTVTIPTGGTSKTFAFQAAPVSATTVGTITAQWGNAQKSKSVNVNPATLDQLLINPNPIHGGDSGTGTVKLAGLAGPGVSVAVTDNTSLIGTPTSVTVPLGAGQADFSFTTSHVTADTTRTITASYKGVTRTVTVTLKK